LVRDYYTQAGYRVRFDWGPDGADAVGPGAAYVAVVDVLSFTTTVTVAVERGIAVLPYRWRDESAALVARQHDATLAVGRAEAGPGDISLSPESVLRATGVTRLVLPSPNGSTVSARLAEVGATVVAVSLRNAVAAAAWVRARWPDDAAVAVVAAGERWNDGPLRPAAEDLWGAGAFIAALIDEPPLHPIGDRHAAAAGHSTPAPASAGRMRDELASLRLLSPEARAALAAYRDIAPSLPAALSDCASGRELLGNGYPGEITVAGERADSTAVPVLVDGWFVAGT
jgi:2-phosphosulfolactate phosphatase